MDIWIVLTFIYHCKNNVVDNIVNWVNIVLLFHAGKRDV